jgi:hypothetical protein
MCEDLVTIYKNMAHFFIHKAGALWIKKWVFLLHKMRGFLNLASDNQFLKNELFTYFGRGWLWLLWASKSSVDENAARVWY